MTLTYEQGQRSGGARRRWPGTGRRLVSPWGRSSRTRRGVGQGTVTPPWYTHEGHEPRARAARHCWRSEVPSEAQWVPDRASQAPARLLSMPGGQDTAGGVRGERPHPTRRAGLPLPGTETRSHTSSWCQRSEPSAVQSCAVQADTADVSASTRTWRAAPWLSYLLAAPAQQRTSAGSIDWAPASRTPLAVD